MVLWADWLCWFYNLCLCLSNTLNARDKFWTCWKTYVAFKNQWLKGSPIVLEIRIIKIVKELSSKKGRKLPGHEEEYRGDGVSIGAREGQSWQTRDMDNEDAQPLDTTDAREWNDNVPKLLVRGALRHFLFYHLWFSWFGAYMAFGRIWQHGKYSYGTGFGSDLPTSLEIHKD